MSGTPTDGLSFTVTSVAPNFDFTDVASSLAALDLGGVEVVVAGIGLTGPPGPGGSASIVSGQFNSAYPAGTPVSVDRATGCMVASSADYKPLAFVVGLLTADSVAGFYSDIEKGQLSLADWTAVTGSPDLMTGQLYFLGVNGLLTIMPATAPNCVALVGEAISPRIMLIRPSNPIQL